MPAVFDGSFDRPESLLIFERNQRMQNQEQNQQTLGNKAIAGKKVVDYSVNFPFTYMYQHEHHIR